MVSSQFENRVQPANPKSDCITATVKRKGASGFALVAVLLLMSLSTAMLYGFKTIGQVLIETEKIKMQCEQTVFQFQNQMAKKLTDLMRLNKKASRLRVQYKLAQMQFLAAAASGNQTGMIRAERKMDSTRMKQVFLDQEQKQILATAQLLANQIKVQANRKMIQYSPRIKTSSLMVKPDNFSDVAPVYLVVPGFTNLQTARIQWKWTHPQPDKTRKEYKDYCAATIEVRGHYYKPRLTL